MGKKYKRMKARAKAAEARVRFLESLIRSASARREAISVLATPYVKEQNEEGIWMSYVTQTPSGLWTSFNSRTGARYFAATEEEARRLAGMEPPMKE